MLRIFPYSEQMWENTDQNNCKYGHFLRSVIVVKIFENAVIGKKTFMCVAGEFYVLHMVGGVRLMKMPGIGKGDQLDVTASYMCIC